MRARRGHSHRVGIDTSNELNLPRQTVWVFDNVIIRMTEAASRRSYRRPPEATIRLTPTL